MVALEVSWCGIRWEFYAGGHGSAAKWVTGDVSKVRKMPSWPRSWANFSLFASCATTGMPGPTYIFWANLTPFSFKRLRQIEVYHIFSVSRI
jgi:hypothetical protein